MEITQFVVDAFSDKVFEGNPAAVCLLDHWISENLMKSIALENNFSETAFLVKEDKGFRLRWFTPRMEIDLCGHATLAAAYIITRFVEPSKDIVLFQTLSGILAVRKESELLFMKLPSCQLKPVEITNSIIEAIGIRPLEAYLGRDLVCVLSSVEQVHNITPDLSKIEALDGLLLHVTARGNDKYDCVSRTFAPKCGVVEDAVCGSGHCHLIPYWSEKLHKKELIAYQASPRGGTLYCKENGKHVVIGGKSTLYSKATIYV